MNPLITIAMPVYNAGEYLNTALDSILVQTYTNWELIIIDDGSTDDAIDSIKYVKDKRVKILVDKLNVGLAARLNQAIDLAKGKYFARMDQDDISLPSRLEMQLNFLEADSNLDLVGSKVLTVNSENEVIGHLPFAFSHQQICAKPWRGFYMPHPTWMGRIEWFRNHKYASPAPYFCEDQELLLRTYKKSQFACLEQVLLHYRIRGEIHLNKLINTHWTLLKCQLSVFSWNETMFKILAITVFILRVLKDIFLKISEYKK